MVVVGLFELNYSVLYQPCNCFVFCLEGLVVKGKGCACLLRQHPTEIPYGIPVVITTGITNRERLTKEQKPLELGACEQLKF